MSGSELPAALRPWEPELRVLAPELAASLQDAIRQLAAAIGPLTSPPVQGDGEPDGFDGVDRRGPFDRLLLSEWLLADEIPTEFLRRAANREQAFLRLRRVDPGTSRRTVVLLDAGPSQLGEPRLAHLVALVVLSRRARAAKAEFRWGVLQGGTLHEDLGPTAMVSFRRSPTHRDPTRAMFEAWAERLDGERLCEGASPSEPDDVWVVGGEDSEAFEGTHLHIEEVLEPGIRELALTLRRRGQHRSLRLQIPRHRDAVRIFRDPIKRGSVPIQRHAVGTGPMWFSPDGNRLLVMSDTGAEALHVPPNLHSLQNGGRGYTRSWEQPGLVAVGWRGRKFTGAYIEGDELVDAGGRRAKISAHLQLADRPVPCYRNFRGVMFVDAHRQLWCMPQMTVLGATVIGWDEAGWYTSTQGVRQVSWAGQLVGEVPDCQDALVLGYGGRAWPVADGCWQVEDRMLRVTQPLDEGVTVHGLVGGKTDGWRGHLLALSADRKDILRVGSTVTVLHSGASPVDGLCASPKRDHIAWRREDGELRVLDLSTNDELVQLGAP